MRLLLVVVLGLAILAFAIITTWRLKPTRAELGQMILPVLVAGFAGAIASALLRDAGNQ